MASISFSWVVMFMIQITGFSSFHSEAIPKEAGALAPHPFYISVTEVNHNEKDKAFEISCKMFADDFEQVLEKNNKTRLDISTAKDKVLFDRFIPAYMNNHLSLTVDGKPARLNYVGYEKDKESVYCYFQVNDIAAPRKISINNSILYDFNETEINIMHVVVGGKRQSTKLDYPGTVANFSF